MILADRSVWIGHLRGRTPALSRDLQSRLDNDEIHICGPVVAEILTGASAQDQRALTEVFSSLPWINIGPLAWVAIGVVSAHLKRRGLTVPLIDITIAIAAALAGAALWTLHRDFTRIQQALPSLRLHQPL